MRNLTASSTDITIYVRLLDSSSTTGAGLTGLVYNSSGLKCYYAREGSASAALTLATQTVTGVHSDGGFVEVDATNMPGLYRLDLSDAMVAAGADAVHIMLTGATNLAPYATMIQFRTYDVGAVYGNVNGSVTNVSPVNVTQISGDSTAANNLEADYDGTGYSKTNSSISSVTGSVGSVTGAVGSVTGAVGSVIAQVSADVTAISGDATAANNLEADYDGTGYSKTNSSINQVASVTGSVGSVTGDVNGDVLGSVQSGVDGLTNNSIADQVWNELLSGHTTAGSAGKALSDVEDGTAVVSANTTQISGDSTAADNLEAQYDGTGYTDPKAPARQEQVDNLAASLTTIEGKIDTVDANVDSVLADTSTDGVVVNTFTTAGKAEVEAEVTDALEAENLNYLVKDAATLATHVTAGSVVDQMLDDGTATYDRTTDSLQAIADGSSLSAADVWDYDVTSTAAGADKAGNVLDKCRDDAASILTDTSTTLPAQISGLNDLSTTEVTLSVPSVDEIASGVWNEPKVDHQEAATFGGEVQSHLSSLDDVGDAVWDEPIAAHNLTDTFGRVVSKDIISAANISDIVWTETIADHSGESGSTAEALANAGVGVGGNASINVAPLVVGVNDLSDNPEDITLYQDTAAPVIVFTIVDANGDAVDCSSKSLRFNVAEVNSTTASWTRATGGSGVTVTGTSNNLVNVAYTTTNTATIGSYKYWLWSITDDEVYKAGTIEIKETVKSAAS